MTNDQAKDLVGRLLDSAGITLNGDRPYDIQVKNEKLYKRILYDGILGLGEAYMDDWWTCACLDQLADRVARTNIRNEIEKSWKLRRAVLKSRILTFKNPAVLFR